MQQFSCPITVSGGTPGYTWSLFLNGNIVGGASTLPPGLQTTSTDTTYTIAGTPEQRGTYRFTVTVQDTAQATPPQTASFSFTLTVSIPRSQSSQS